MIVYFADRYFNILGQASTELPDGLKIIDDRRVGDVETGVTVFEFTMPFNETTRALAESCGDVGHYLLRSHEGKNDFYTVIDAEVDTKRQEVTVYAEDAGLDLLNEIVEAYAADKAYTINHYIEKFAYDSGFRIGLNEAAGLTRKLSWDGDATAAERIASVATQFGGFEISYSFEFDGLSVTKKLINIHKQRGNDAGVSLRLNRELDRIITKKSIMNFATALLPIGGTPEEAENPINLSGYQYDDGDIYLEGRYLKSRSALAKWSRYLNPSEPMTTYTGHILKKYTSEALSQKTLCSEAVAELKKISQIEVNYEIEMERLPDGVGLGDRINIVDDAGELYMSARILQLEESVANNKQTATLGEYLIKGSGISQKVAALAAKFAEQAQANAKAAAAAAAAKEAAEQAEQAANEAQNAIENAETAAQDAQAKAAEAITKAAQAMADAADANAAISVVQNAADSAAAKADAALADATQAKTDAETAAVTANAAKVDAAKAQEDIGALGEELEIVSQIMTADYARKTDLTEATATLQTQISQNAGQISSTATKVQEIDETANNASTQAQAAQAKADAAQSAADKAVADAEKAQTAATNAATAASNAQSEADAAMSAASEAKTAADKAEEDLATAQANLEAVTSRVGVTEAEIAEAQAAVVTAQAAADKAKADAAAAQSTADTAKANAATAQTAANNAKSTADNAKSVADAAKQAADAAKADVDALAVRVTTAETNISQNAEEIALRAKKSEVTETLGGYYTKTEADAKLKVEADKISSVVQTVDSQGTRLSAVEQTASGLSVRLDNAEDDIDNAAKTATNFLSYDASGGLQIGNKSSGAWSGYRTQIKSDSFNVLDANGNAMSTFGANKIDLGKNNDDTVISLCNDRARMQYDAEMQWFGLESSLTKYSPRDYPDDAPSDYWTSWSGLGLAPYNGYANLLAQGYFSDANGNSVGNIDVRSDLYIRENQIDLNSDGLVYINAPAITLDTTANPNMGSEGIGINGDMDILGDLKVDGDLEAKPTLVSVYDANNTSASAFNTKIEAVFSAMSDYSIKHILFRDYPVLNGTTYGGLLYRYSASYGALIGFNYTNPHSFIIMKRKMEGSWLDWEKPMQHHPFRTTMANLAADASVLYFFNSASDAQNATGDTAYVARTNNTLVLRTYGASSAGNIDIYPQYGNVRLAAANKFVTAQLSDRFRPITNDQQYLGDSTYKWKAVYAVSGTIQTSDRNEKTNIEELSDKYVALFDRLLPVSFMYSDKESDRTHIGFISQDVEAAMAEVGLTDLDFAGFCKDIKMSPEVLDEDGNVIEPEKPILDENGDPVYSYSLRYSEFIALNSKMIQINRKKTQELQKEVDDLKKIVEKLREKVGI